MGVGIDWNLLIWDSGLSNQMAPSKLGHVVRSDILVMFPLLMLQQPFLLVGWLGPC